MRIRRPSHRNSHTFLVHVFGRGLDGDRYVVERFRSRPDGQIDPVEAGQPTSRKGGRRPRRTVVSAGEVKKMQPERDEIIICTALDLKASGVQIWGLLRPAEFPPCATPAERERRSWLAAASRRSGPTPAFAVVTSSESRAGSVPAAARPSRSPASRCAATAATSAVPPTAPAAQGPEPRESLTAAGTPISAAVPSAPGTGGAGRAWRDAGLCSNCGRNPPEDGRSVCEPCREARRADRPPALCRSPRCRCLCVRCAEPAVGGSSRCARHAALEAERVSPERKKAADRKRYARRRAQGRCTDCGVHAAGAARCPACARRSNTRMPAYHGAPAGPPFYTVIELDTGEDHGTYETEAEVAACLAFAGLRPDQVDVRSNVPLLALALTALPQECAQ